MTRRILALDPGLRGLGWALVSGAGEVLRLGARDLGAKPNLTRTLKDTAAWLRESAESVWDQATEVVVERQHVTNHFLVQTSGQACMFVGEAERRGLPWRWAAPGAAPRAFGCPFSGSKDRARRKRWITELLETREPVLCADLGARRHDAADAYLMALHALQLS